MERIFTLFPLTIKSKLFILVQQPFRTKFPSHLGLLLAVLNRTHGSFVIWCIFILGQHLIFRCQADLLLIKESSFPSIASLLDFGISSRVELQRQILAFSSSSSLQPVSSFERSGDTVQRDFLQIINSERNAVYAYTSYIKL